MYLVGKINSDGHDKRPGVTNPDKVRLGYLSPCPAAYNDNEQTLRQVMFAPARNKCLWGEGWGHLPPLPWVV